MPGTAGEPAAAVVGGDIMAQDIRMDTDRLLSVCNEFEEGLSELEKALEKMKTDVDSLNGIWEGPSHDKFVSDYEKDYQQMADMNKGLRKYLEKLKEARKKYADCETEVNSLVDGL